MQNETKNFDKPATNPSAKEPSSKYPADGLWQEQDGYITFWGPNNALLLQYLSFFLQNSNELRNGYMQACPLERDSYPVV